MRVSGVRGSEGVRSEGECEGSEGVRSEGECEGEE